MEWGAIRTLRAVPKDKRGWARALDERVALGALGPVEEPREQVPRCPLPGPFLLWFLCLGGGAKTREKAVGTGLMLHLG